MYYRHELGKSARNLILLGLAPLLGGLMLFGVFVKAMVYYGETANVETAPILGITLPLWLGIGGLLVGVVLMLISRPFFRGFFARKLETARPGVVGGAGGARAGAFLEGRALLRASGRVRAQRFSFLTRRRPALSPTFSALV